MGLKLRVMAFIFLFFVHFSFFPYILHGNIKKFYVGVFSGTFKARMLKLGIHMNNELLYYGIGNRTPCFYFPFICPFFCLLRLNLCHCFLRNCKLESSNMVYICRMSDCIVGLRLRVMAFIFLFVIHFSFFPYITC